MVKKLAITGLALAIIGGVAIIFDKPNCKLLAIQNYLEEYIKDNLGELKLRNTEIMISEIVTLESEKELCRCKSKITIKEYGKNKIHAERDYIYTVNLESGQPINLIIESAENQVDKQE